MAKHLPGKVARAISDFVAIGNLIDLIEHELEKRIVARHALVKLDALLGLLAQLKNEMRRQLPQQQKQAVNQLEEYISRLRHDLDKSDLTTGRDAMAAHALKLDLRRIVETWTMMGATTFGVLQEDLLEVDAELKRLSATHPAVLAYPGLCTWSLDPQWTTFWRSEGSLGNPSRPRLANIYPGLATAGVVAPIPTKNAAQDATIRAAGLASFLFQAHLILQPMDRGSELERLLAELMLNDYIALWELLFTSGVRNEHGEVDKCLLEHWEGEHFAGAACLKTLSASPHPSLAQLRSFRNTCTAHIDPDAEIWEANLARWPMTINALQAEVARVSNYLHRCARMDIRSQVFFIKPQYIGGREIVGLAAQEGKRWSDG